MVCFLNCVPISNLIQDKDRDKDKFITPNPYTYGNMRNNVELDDTRLDNM